MVRGASYKGYMNRDLRRHPPYRPLMKPIHFTLRGEFVELHHLLKLTGLCASGGEGQHMVASGAVRVDGHVELRKRYKVRNGQCVSFADQQILIFAQEPG